MSNSKELTKETFDRLTAELYDLRTRGRIDIARKIETARELGDLSENGDYHAAKEEQGKMEGRIQHLESMLEDVVVIETAECDKVSTGNVVTIKFVGSDTAERYLIGSIEERLEGVTVLSPGSPLGEAMVGAKVGDVVSFAAPAGELKVEIVDISN